MQAPARFSPSLREFARRAVRSVACPRDNRILKACMMVVGRAITPRHGLLPTMAMEGALPICGFPERGPALNLAVTMLQGQVQDDVPVSDDAVWAVRAGLTGIANPKSAKGGRITEGSILRRPALSGSATANIAAPDDPLCPFQ